MITAKTLALVAGTTGAFVQDQSGYIFKFQRVDPPIRIAIKPEIRQQT